MARRGTVQDSIDRMTASDARELSRAKTYAGGLSAAIRMQRERIFDAASAGRSSCGLDVPEKYAERVAEDLRSDGFVVEGFEVRW